MTPDPHRPLADPPTNEPDTHAVVDSRYAVPLSTLLASAHVTAAEQVQLHPDPTAHCWSPSVGSDVGGDWDGD